MRRIGLVLCLLVLAAGCGGARRASTVPRLPGPLAQSWAQRADAVAAAATAGDSCGASRLADSLQHDVIARQASVPLRYRTVLLQAVSRLASGIACTPTTVTVVTPPPTHPHPHPHSHGPPGHHDKHGHGPPGPGDGG
jgi:hypothetical protein